MPLPNPFFFLERPKPKRHGKLFIVPAVDFEDLPKAKTRFLIRSGYADLNPSEFRATTLRWNLARVLERICSKGVVHAQGA
ncbi:hypothetical protein V6N13_017386 [Hibiscus sabdariffa]